MLPLAPSCSPILSSPELSVQMADACLLVAPVRAANVFGHQWYSTLEQVSSEKLSHTFVSKSC